MTFSWSKRTHGLTLDNTVDLVNVAKDGKEHTTAKSSSMHSSHHGKIVQNFYDIKLPVALIVVAF